MLFLKSAKHNETIKANITFYLDLSEKISGKSLSFKLNINDGVGE